MNWIQELEQSESLQSNLTTFLNQYGLSGLEHALQLYTNLQQEYICRTKTSISKINLIDIYYLEIRTHTITVHTQHGSYQKYGSLTDEEKLLSPYGFIKCNQSCIVNLGKIRSICNDTITLINNTQLHMSHLYAPKVLIAFSCNSISKSS